MLLTYKLQKKILIFSFLFLPLLILFFFFVYPAIGLLYVSLTDWKGYGPMTFVGLDKYARVFSEPQILGTIVHNLYYLAGGIVQIFIGLLLAILCNKQFIGKNLFRAIIFLPYIINSISISFMFFYIYLPDGPYNQILMFFHLIAEPLKFLSRDLVNISLAAISFWQYLGFYMVVFLAGLQTIPPDYYEASKVDGASFWQDLFYITIPNLIPIIELAMFLVISGSLKVFDFPFVLTRGGPNGASDTLATKSIQLAFQFNDYGTAAGLSVIMVVIIIVITLIQRKLLNTKE